ncbi:hypothetical protein V7R84_13605 [Arachnia propionica]|uniref:hypothetical protein n=1 Tax=Arachnia propionica TaxID=1750 RepID=UPI0030D5EFCD
MRPRPRAASTTARPHPKGDVRARSVTVRDRVVTGNPAMRVTSSSWMAVRRTRRRSL